MSVSASQPGYHPAPSTVSSPGPQPTAWTVTCVQYRPADVTLARASVIRPPPANVGTMDADGALVIRSPVLINPTISVARVVRINGGLQFSGPDVPAVDEHGVLGRGAGE